MAANHTKQEPRWISQLRKEDRKERLYLREPDFRHGSSSWYYDDRFTVGELLDLYDSMAKKIEVQAEDIAHLEKELGSL